MKMALSMRLNRLSNPMRFTLYDPKTKIVVCV